ncbi:MAG: YcjF family protein [Deltaproteobacteria bacterium]|nr:YcjF family protein [Deltaproteobacteria bacterium]
MNKETSGTTETEIKKPKTKDAEIAATKTKPAAIDPTGSMFVGGPGNDKPGEAVTSMPTTPMEVTGMDKPELDNIEPQPIEMTAGEREAKANGVIKNRVLWAMGAGLVPIPLLDMAALTAIQMEMVRSLAKMYDIPFSKDITKTVIASLLGSVIPVSLCGPLSSLIKIIPLIGQTTGVITMSLVGGAATYAIGRVFLQHFESGGTFLDFQPQKVKEYFAEQYEDGKKVVSGLKGSK